MFKMRSCSVRVHWNLYVFHEVILITSKLLFEKIYFCSDKERFKHTHIFSKTEKTTFNLSVWRFQNKKNSYFLET